MEIHSQSWRRFRALLLALIAVPSLAEPAWSAVTQQEQASVIDEIVLNGAGDRDAAIRSALSLRVGEEFSMERWRRDVDFLWSRMRVRLESLRLEELGNGHTRVLIDCVVLEAFRRVLFLGHDEDDISREELLLATGLSGAQAIDRATIPRIRADIIQAFRRKGFYFVEVSAEVHEDRDEVAFLIQQGPKVRVGQVDFIGNKVIPSDAFVGTDLEGTVESGDGWFIFPGTPFTDETMQGDRIALEKLYHEYGYLEAVVTPLEPEFYRDNHRVKLTYQIDEGPQFLVRSVDVQPAVGDGPLSYPREELFDLIELASGDPLEEARINRDAAALRRYYGDRGHTVAPRGAQGDDTFFRMTVERVLGEDNSYDVIYRIHEGHVKHIRDVLISGNIYTQDRVIRREIGLEPGDLANMAEAADSHRRLMGLSYFLDEETGQPYVDYRFIPTEEPDQVDLHYQVSEGRGTGNILFGGGLSSNNGPFVSVNLQKNNFDITDLPSTWGNAFSEIIGGEAFTGGGQTLRLFLAPGSRFSTYRLSFYEPDLLREHINRLGFRIDAYKTFRFLRTHDEDRTGLGINLSRRFGRYFSVFAGPRAEKVSLNDIEPGAPTGIGLDDEYTLWRRSLALGVNYSTVKDQFSPVDSHKMRLELRQNGGFLGGDMDFPEADFSFGEYLGLWDDSLGRTWTLAFEGRVRKAWTSANESVPYTERYWTGGTNTVRGFDYRGIGRTANGFAVGGEAAINASLELRFPIMSARIRDEIAEFQWVRGAFFLDAGTFGDDFGDLDPVRVGAGIGVRIRLPMMPQFPIALDFGWPLSSEEFDDERVFTLNFGEF